MELDSDMLSETRITTRLDDNLNCKRKMQNEKTEETKDESEKTVDVNSPFRNLTSFSVVMLTLGYLLHKEEAKPWLTLLNKNAGRFYIRFQ